MSDVLSLWSGKVVSGYTLKTLRGQGGYGSVWEAESPQKQPVALKFLKCNDSASAAQEIRAIRAVSQLQHPNLTHIDQVWLHEGFIVVTMELADGSLMDLIEAYRTENTDLSVKETLDMFDQAAAAIDFLNKRQHMLDGVRVAIQHCDIKPSNMLLFGDILKLCDYSLASITTSSAKAHRRAGTLDYAAPEVFQGRLSDHTDQFSLAVSYCVIRGGKFPFPPAPRTFEKGYIRPKPNLEMLMPGERVIVARGLSPVPQDRWPSCGEFIAQLRKCV